MRWSVGYVGSILSVVIALTGCSPFSLVGGNAPEVELTPPPGYRAVTTTHFGFVVPKKWFDDGSDGSYLFEHRHDPTGSWLAYASYFTTNDDKDTKLPKLVGYYANTDSYTVVEHTRLDLPEASAAWRYDFVDAAGRRHIAVNVKMIPDCEKPRCWGKGLWLVVNVDEPRVGKSVAQKMIESLEVEF